MLQEIDFRHPIVSARRLIHERKEVRYLIAGTTSEGIEYVSFLLLIWVMPNLLYVANSISFIFGVVSGFIIHKLWTFRGEQQFKTHHQLVGYLSLAGINFVAINVFVGVYDQALGLSPALSKLLAIATTVVWTYLISNYVIFRHQAAKPNDL